jgi:hypothetical protein
MTIDFVDFYSNTYYSFIFPNKFILSTSYCSWKNPHSIPSFIYLSIQYILIKLIQHILVVYTWILLTSNIHLITYTQMKHFKQKVEYIPYLLEVQVSRNYKLQLKDTTK